MNDKEINEVGFWKNLFNNDLCSFVEIRKKDAEELFTAFPELYNETGTGLDYGCGLMSLLSFCNKDVVAFDPLLPEYNNIHPFSEVTYTDKIANKVLFDWIVLCNVIDHTSEPETIIKNIKRHLKKNGKIYFEINFDDELGAAHYSLWNQKLVDNIMSDFKLIRSTIERNQNFPQSKYWAIYQKCT